MKTRKRYLALVVIVITMVLSACGGTGSDQQTLEQRSEEATTADAQTVEEATETPAETTEASEPNVAESSSVVLEVIVKDDKHADFVFYGYGGESISDITVLDISYDSYSASFNSFMNNDCNVWNDEDNGKVTLCEGGKAGYTIENEKITITVDMSGVSGFSFDNVSGDCVIHYEHGENGGPNMTLTWEDVANMDNYVSASQVAQSDTSVKEDEEKASEYWYIGIRFRDTVGREFYFLEPDEKGNPTKITLSGFAGTGTFADDINNGTYDFITELNEMSETDYPWIQGRIIGSGNLMIKKELADDQFRKIVVDIWTVEE